MRKPAQKEKLTHEAMLATDQSLEVWKTLPVHQLPEVQQLHRAEFKKTEPSRAKRIGRFAVDAVAGVSLVASNPQMYARSIERNEESFRTGKGINFIGRIAARRLIKREQRSQEADKRWQATHQTAVNKYREQHPEIANKEAELHEKWNKEQHEQNRRRTFADTVSRGNYAVEYFQRGNAYSFSKSIPRRARQGREAQFEGSYFDLAKNTLADAATHRTEDGTIPLLGSQIQRERFLEKEAAGVSLRDIKQSENSYVQGASTALWQLGFVEFKSEDHIPYGNGKFSEAIEWGKTENRGVTARLAYNPENELHQLLMPEGSTFANPMLEVEMSSEQRMPNQPAPYMNLRIVDAAVPAQIAA